VLYESIYVVFLSSSQSLLFFFVRSKGKQQDVRILLLKRLSVDEAQKTKLRKRAHES
jgi:hypothetical protein